MLYRPSAASCITTENVIHEITPSMLRSWAFWAATRKFPCQQWDPTVFSHSATAIQCMALIFDALPFERRIRDIGHFRIWRFCTCVARKAGGLTECDVQQCDFNSDEPVHQWNSQLRRTEVTYLYGIGYHTKGVFWRCLREVFAFTYSGHCVHTQYIMTESVIRDNRDLRRQHEKSPPMTDPAAFHLISWSSSLA
ncbi:hypothetical protein EDC04DRAFT_2183239 [Pisolithus marmoratus]|nr:hypothetical protein EDC04DRAFT_2183239 [Pisolithus marmoratus]